jgi:hypothetical protein
VLAKQPGTDRLLLVVDQWEELYTQARDDDAKLKFLDEGDAILLSINEMEKKRVSVLPTFGLSSAARRRAAGSGRVW